MKMTMFGQRKSSANKVATGIALGMVAGATLGAIGAYKMSGVSSNKMMKNAKKSFKKNADKVMYGAQSVIDAIPKFMS